MELDKNRTIVIVVVCIATSIGAVSIHYIAYLQKHAEIQAKINAQTEVEKTKIQQEAEVQRTKERMNLVQWYRGGENKESK